MAGLLGVEIQPNRRLGSELSDYAKTRGKLGGIIHSDEDLAKYPISTDEDQRVRQALGVTEKDAFVLAAGNPDSCQTGLTAVQHRLQLALSGIPGETRNALENGSSEYLRTLAGGSRMYPETDVPLIPILPERLNPLKKRLPKTLAERETLYAKHGLSKQLSDKMKLDNLAPFFEELLDQKMNATTGAVLLLETLPSLEREHIPSPSRLEIEKLLELERDKKIDKKALAYIIMDADKYGRPIADVALDFQLPAVDEANVRHHIQEIIARNGPLIAQKGKGAMSALMGDAMKQLGKTVPGKDISRILDEELAKELKK